MFPVDKKPPANAMMDRLAPNTAALDTPNVDGEAIGLLSVVCIISPDTDNPAPAISAASTRGTLIFHIILICAGVPFLKSACMQSMKVIFAEPAKRHSIVISSTINTSTAAAILFFLFLLLIYSAIYPNPYFFYNTNVPNKSFSDTLTIQHT